MNKQIMQKMGFGKEIEAVKYGFCPTCKQPIVEFRDELSVREHAISGMCQECQNTVFGEES